MKVRFLIRHESHEAGTEAEIPDDRARMLLKAGVAVEVKPANTPPGDSKREE